MKNKKEEKILDIPLGEIRFVNQYILSNPIKCIPMHFKNSNLFKLLDDFYKYFTFYYLFKTKEIKILFSAIITIIFTLIMPSELRVFVAIVVFIISYFMHTKIVDKMSIMIANLTINITIETYEYMVNHPEQFNTWSNIDLFIRYIHNYLTYKVGRMNLFVSHNKLFRPRIESNYHKNLVINATKRIYSTIINTIRENSKEKYYINVFTKEKVADSATEMKILEIYCAVPHREVIEEYMYNSYKKRFNI